MLRMHTVIVLVNVFSVNHNDQPTLITCVLVRLLLYLLESAREINNASLMWVHS